MSSGKSQSVTYYLDRKKYSFTIPGPQEKVLDGIFWGSPDELFTPAYWSIQSFLAEFRGSCVRLNLGTSFLEEVVACLLGGHGIPAEVGVAAFQKIRSRGMLSGCVVPERELEEALREPLLVNGRFLRYRFASQKSRFIHQALHLITSEEPPERDLELRKWLLKIKGVGLKTASWITRNWTRTDSVAIIDIHIHRAGKLIGLFKNQRPETHYLEMEDLFLQFARGVHARTSTLDSVIWSQMRSWGNLAFDDSYKH